MAAVSKGVITNKQELWSRSILTCNEFLCFNALPLPIYMTYEAITWAEYHAAPQSRKAVNFLRRVISKDNRRQGAGTGLYYDGHVFVNIPVCAVPRTKPFMQSWSWPGWKTDRTAYGVVAHEVGHHVEVVHTRERVRGYKDLIYAWKKGLSEHRKERVSGYEPVPSEAWAETLRLFILNPDLLRKACPWRYDFVFGCGLRALPSLLRKGWKRVLNNENYCEAAERWIERGRKK